MPGTAALIALEGHRLVAFVIISAGPVTNPSQRTIDAGPLLLIGSALLALLVAGGVGVGYRIATLRAESGSAVAQAPGSPDGEALAAHVGSLAGRLSRLEGAATSLGKRVGLDTAPAADQSAEDPGGPAGGPFIPVSGRVAGADAPGAARIDIRDLDRLERQIEAVADRFARLEQAVAERELETMAYPYRLPIAGHDPRVSSAYGVRHDPFTGRLARHTGLDIPAPHGTPVLASGGGRVVSAGDKGAYGRTVVIDHGDGLATLYGHASRLLVRTGDIVMPNQPIALVGSTGRSTGPHLHFEVIRHGARVEPRQYLSQVHGRGPPP